MKRLLLLLLFLSSFVYANLTHDTPRRVADTNNNIIWSWESKPFGEDKPTGTFTLNLRFPGQYYDKETDTHYNINRDYNPLTGRYMQSDPIGFDGGINTYLYANANSLRFSDASGEFAILAAIPEAIELGISAYNAYKVAKTIRNVVTVAKVLAKLNEEDSDDSPIYYHYTNEENFDKIMASGMIKKNSNGFIYASPCEKSPSEVENDLFIGLKSGYGDYVIAFQPKKGTYFAPLSICEVVYSGGNLRFGRHIKVISAGKNGF